MFRKLPIVIILFLHQAFLLANETVEQLQNRTLVIILEAPQKSQLNKLKPDEQVSYNKAIEGYNRKIREVGDKFWELNSKKEFKTWDEVNVLIKSKAQGYLILYAGNYSVDPRMNDFMSQKGLDFSPEIFMASDKRDYRQFYTAFNLAYLESFKKGESIISRTVTNLWPLKEDMIFACQYIQSILFETKRTNMKMTVESIASSHNEQLADWVLLLKRDLLSDRVIDEKFYPYKLEIVSHDSLLAKIFDKQKVIYVEVVPQMVGTGEAYRLGYEHVLVNANTGMIVGYVPVSAGVLHATAGHGYHHKYISAGIFQQYLQKEFPVSSPKESRE